MIEDNTDPLVEAMAAAMWQRRKILAWERLINALTGVAAERTKGNLQEAIDEKVYDWKRHTAEATGDRLLEIEEYREMARVAITAIVNHLNPSEWRIDTDEGKIIMALRKTAYEAACRQTDCAGKGFDETDCGKCAYCADIADGVIETYLRAAAIRIGLRVRVKPTCKVLRQTGITGTVTRQRTENGLVGVSFSVPVEASSENGVPRDWAPIPRGAGVWLHENDLEEI